MAVLLVPGAIRTPRFPSRASQRPWRSSVRYVQKGSAQLFFLRSRAHALFLSFVEKAGKNMGEGKEKRGKGGGGGKRDSLASKLALACVSWAWTKGYLFFGGRFLHACSVRPLFRAFYERLRAIGMPLVPGSAWQKLVC